MALNAMRYSFGNIARRSLSQTSVPAYDFEHVPDVQCTVLPNKLMIASLDLNGPLSRVSFVFRAGPRNETPKNLGITHVIRSMAGFGTKKCTGFSIWRNLQQNGIHIYCTGDREVTGFHVVGARHKLNCALKYLSAVVSFPAFKPWEVKDNAPRLHYEIGCLSHHTRLIDDLHKAAYRTGLGNSLFIRKERIGTYSTSELEAFYAEGFTFNRGTLASYNVEHKEMLEFAQSLELCLNDPPQGNSTYYGGELRNEYDSYFAHVAIGTEGEGIKDVKTALIYSVLQHAYGVYPVVLWGGSPSPLYKAIYPVTPDAGVSCFNYNYSDSGLFGVLISCSADSAESAVPTAFKVLKSGTVSDADFNRAKALVKMNLLSESENSGKVLEDICIQSLNGGLIIPAPVLAEAVDKITLSDVNKAAQKVAKGKFSMVAYGDVTKVPYLSDLC